MAVTSIWRISGSLSGLVNYASNSEKTVENEQDGSLSDVIGYAVNSVKTEKTDDENVPVIRRFVSGVNCSPNTAKEEMIAVKKRFGKEDGTVAYHGYQSFAPGEATPETAHEIGVKLARKLWGDKYQVLVATHLDKESHLHNHFIVNTVSFLDGIKYHRTEKNYYNMQKASDELCKEYGLSIIENPIRGKSKHYAEWRAEQEQRPTWRGMIKSDIDEAIRQSMTERQFFDNLKLKGYEIKVGKDISVRPPQKERFVRLVRNFGDDYSIESIRKRILEQTRPKMILPEPEYKPKEVYMKGDFKKTKKVKGFRALYFHYCYLLGIFPKNRKVNNKKLHFLLREDLIKLDNISKEARLLCRNQIDTAEQLSLYQNSLEERIETLTAERKELYKQKRSKAVMPEIHDRISALSKELSQLRTEVKLCNNIFERSEIMKEKLKTVRDDEKQREESNRNEQFRRRSGTGCEIKS